MSRNFNCSRRECGNRWEKNLQHCERDGCHNFYTYNRVGIDCEICEARYCSSCSVEFMTCAEYIYTCDECNSQKTEEE